MSDLLDQFLDEARELLQEVNAGLLALEEAPERSDLLDDLFRSVHTLKGSSALFDLAPLTELLHAGEDVLGRLRQEAGPPEPAVLDALFQALDQVEAWIGDLAATGDLPEGAPGASADQVDRLKGLFGQSEGAGEAPGAEGPSLAEVVAEWPEALLRRAYEEGRDAGGVVAVEYTPARDCFFAGEDPLQLMRGVPGLVAFDVEAVEPWPDPGELDPFQSRLRLRAVSTAPPDQVSGALAYVANQVRIGAGSPEGLVGSQGSGSREVPSPGEVAGESGRESTALRVEQGKIDRLMNLAGELIVATNGIPYLADRAEDPDATRAGLARALKEQHALFDRLARELQGEVMQVRMLPVSHVFQRFPRMVRDLARKLGKQARLETSGEGAEADKQILDRLAEPLTHIVRNSLDHGIEPPEDREAAGKPPQGTIRLEAFQYSEQLVVRVADDGRGIDPERVRSKAVERGLIDAEEAARLSDQEAVELVGKAGFSTAAGVSEVSGRGVGMDVVRAMVDQAGGTLGIESGPGEGTRVQLALPLSMAVTRVLLVEAGGQTFGVPFTHVLETLRVDPEAIQGVKQGRALSWRERFLPLLDLAGRLGLSAETEVERPAVMVARIRGEEVAFRVDSFHAGTDVVVKPLVGGLERTPGVSGSAVLGDGSVLLVLSLEELV